MVDVVEQLCIHSYEITAENGDSFKVEQGKEYTTVPEEGKENVTVFSSYWVSIPKRCFVVSETNPYRNNALDTRSKLWIRQIG